MADIKGTEFGTPGTESGTTKQVNFDGKGTIDAGGTQSDIRTMRTLGKATASTKDERAQVLEETKVIPSESKKSEISEQERQELLRYRNLGNMSQGDAQNYHNLLNKEEGVK